MKEHNTLIMKIWRTPKLGDIVRMQNRDDQFVIIAIRFERREVDLRACGPIVRLERQISWKRLAYEEDALKPQLVNVPEAKSELYPLFGHR
jgi:hypothetical protein